MKTPLFLSFFLIVSSLYGFAQHTQYVKLVDGITNTPLDSFQVSVYLVNNGNFEPVSISITNKEGLAEIKSVIDSGRNYKVQADQLRRHVSHFYNETSNMRHFTGDTFVMPAYQWIIHKVRFQQVFFAANSYRLLDFYKGVIDEVLPRFIETLSDEPTFDIVVIGHSDNKGSEDYNRLISLRRAEEVKKYLMSKGIKKNKILIKAKGSSDPLVPNEKNGADDPEGRAQNRRVEFKIDTHTENTPPIEYESHCQLPPPLTHQYPRSHTGI